MPRLLFATVEHSGTRSVCAALGWTMYQLSVSKELGPSDVYFEHLTDDKMPAILQAAMPIFTTARTPNDIRTSWVRRSKPLGALESQLRNYDRLVAERAPFIIELSADPRWICGALAPQG